MTFFLKDKDKEIVFLIFFYALAGLSFKAFFKKSNDYAKIII